MYSFLEAWRSLSQRPSLIIITVLTLGVTLGSLVMALTLNHVLLKKPLPYPQQDTLFVLQHGVYDDKQQLIGNMFPFPGLMSLYQDESLFKQSALLSYYLDSVLIKGKAHTQALSFTTSELQQLLDIKMAKGRFFEVTETIDKAAPVAVISYKTWQSLFESSPDILNQFLEFKGAQFRIIGVTAESFQDPELISHGRQSQIWFPWHFEPSSQAIKNGWGMIHAPLHFLAKLDEPSHAANLAKQLSIEVNNRWQQEVIDFKTLHGWSVTMKLTQLGTFILGDNKNSTVLLLVASSALFILCLVNLVNLFVARAAQKERQLAIRAAVGMPKLGLFKLMLCECSFLVGLSWVLAMGVAWLELLIIKQYLIEYWPRLNELSFSLFSLLSSSLIALFLTYFFATISTQKINFRALITHLHSSGKGTGTQVSKTLRQSLIIIQVSTVFTMVFFASHLLSEAFKPIVKPLGFSADNLMAIRFTSHTSEPPTREQSRQFVKSLRHELTLLPNVKSISQATSPFNDYAVSAVEFEQQSKRYSPHIKWVDDHYFNVIDQTLLFGRFFNAQEIRDNQAVIVINSTLASQLLSNKNIASAIGLYISVYGKAHQIIGVVESLQLPNQANNTARLYMTTSDAWPSLLVLLNEGTTLTADSLNKKAAQIDKRFHVFSKEAVIYHHAHSLLVPTITALLAIFITLLLVTFSFVGLYSMMRYQVRLRRSELATHLALGARQRDLVFLLLNESAFAISLGLMFSSIIIMSLLSITELSLTAIQLITFSGLAIVPVISLMLICCALPLKTLNTSSITRYLQSA